MRFIPARPPPLRRAPAAQSSRAIRAAKPPRLTNPWRRNKNKQGTKRLNHVRSPFPFRGGAFRTGASPRGAATDRADPVRSFRHPAPDGCRGRIRAGRPAAGAGALGAGPAEPGRVRRPLPARHGAGSAAAGPDASRRCAGGAGGRAARPRPGRRGGRDPWHRCGAELHRQPPPGAAGRGGGPALLADPPCRAARTQRGADALAADAAALASPSRRSAGAGRSALAGRAVPGARPAALDLGGAP